MPKRHLQKRAQTVRTLLKSLSANYRNGCPHITEKGVRELVKPAAGRRRARTAHGDAAVLPLPHAAEARPDRDRHVGYVANRPDDLPHPVPHSELPGDLHSSHNRQFDCLVSANIIGLVPDDEKKNDSIHCFDDIDSYRSRISS